jgi:hypothetical protein
VGTREFDAGAAPKASGRFLPAAHEIQRISRSQGLFGATVEKRKALFQALVSQIRYLADQPNFVKDQRIKAALTAE